MWDSNIFYFHLRFQTLKKIMEEKNIFGLREMIKYIICLLAFRQTLSVFWQLYQKEHIICMYLPKLSSITDENYMFHVVTTLWLLQAQKLFG